MWRHNEMPWRRRALMWSVADKIHEEHHLGKKQTNNNKKRQTQKKTGEISLRIAELDPKQWFRVGLNLYD